MGFLKGLLGLGFTAGAAFAAVKVARKYEENKEQDTEAAAAGEDPEEVPAGSVLSDLVRAAGDVLIEAGTSVKNAALGAAEKAGVDTDGLKEALHGAGAAVADAGSAVVSYVAEEAPNVVEHLRDGAQDVLTRVKETVYSVAEEDEAPAEEEDFLAPEADDAQPDDAFGASADYGEPAEPLIFPTTAEPEEEEPEE